MHQACFVPSAVSYKINSADVYMWVGLVLSLVCPPYRFLACAPGPWSIRSVNVNPSNGLSVVGVAPNP
jgi:hypothetical protein